MAHQPDPTRQVTARAVLTVFLPFAGGYYLSYLYRTVTAVISAPLQAELALSAGDLGVLVSAYFVAFAAFQLPLGLLLDRHGPRRVNAVLFALAGVGAGGFALAHSLPALWLARALTGLGCAGGLMAAFKAITQWFPRHRWPVVNGCFLATGGLGAVSATAPVEALLAVTDWRGLFLGLAAATLGVALVLWTVVPEARAEAAMPTLRAQLAGLRAILADRFFWRLAPMAVLCMGNTLAITGLWAGPWLREVAGRAPDTAAAILMGVMLAVTSGFVIWGALANALERRGIPLTVTLGTAVAGFLTVYAIVLLPIATGWVPLWIAFGLMGNVTALSYTLLSRHVPLAYAGRANSALNLFVFILAFGVQAGVGGLIDLWPGTGPGGGEPPAAYRAALGLVWSLCALGWLWFVVRAKRAPHGGFQDVSRVTRGGRRPDSAR